MKRKFVTVFCKECGANWEKRADSLSSWAGKCRSCAMKELSNRPEQLEIRKENGTKVMERVGRLPHYPDRNYRSGPANNKWRGGITPINRIIRASPEAKAWRRAVFERDNYSCLICGKRGGDLEADHIKPFALYPEHRFDIDNGRTLCVLCHRTHGALVYSGRIVREALLTG